MEIKTYSASKLKTYTGCARRYWYTYIQKEEREDHPAAAMGSAVHKVIERLHRLYPNIPTNDAALFFSEEYQRQVEERGIEFNQKYYNEGMKIVLNYDPHKRQPNEMEVEFTLPFPEVQNPLCYIHGFIDHVYDWGFADLKTNRNRPMLGVLDNDLQFIIYDWAFQQIYGVEPEHRLWIHLRTGEEFESQCSNKLHIAIRTIERIQDSEVTGIYDTCIGDACRICPFTEQCLGRK